MPPNPLDFYALDARLTDEERAVRDTVRRFADDEIRPHIAAHWRDGTSPDLMKRFGELGLLGLGIDDGRAAAAGVVYRELERVDSCVRSQVGVQGTLTMFPISRFGSDAQRERWLPALRAGEKIGCFGLSEPDAGSDPGAMRTRATKTSDGWRLSGTKRWITNGTLADVCVVWAKTGEGSRTVRGFLVELDKSGVSRTKIDNKLSFRASDTAELVFDEVELNDDALLPGTTGLTSALEVLVQGRFGISWGVLGAAADCIETALRFAEDRTIFGRPLAATQLAQAKFADMITALTHAQLTAWRLAELKDEGALEPAQVSLAKRSNVRAALNIARTCRDILGANGIMGEYSPMRHLCNLETVDTYEGTYDVHSLVLGAALTGHAAFRA